MIVRRAGACAADAGAVWGLIAQAPALAASWPLAAVVHELGLAGSTTWLARQAGREGDGGLLGALSFRRTPFEVEVMVLVTAPSWRRRGVAAWLVEELLAWAHHDGAEAALVEVSCANAAGLAFYRRLGLARVGRRRAYYPDGSDAQVLRAWLPRG